MHGPFEGHERHRTQQGERPLPVCYRSVTGPLQEDWEGKGRLSPTNKITLSAEVREAASIPPEAEVFAFAYPVSCEETIRAEDAQVGHVVAWNCIVTAIAFALPNVTRSR